MARLHDLVTTDIPQPAEHAAAARAPLELDDDLGRKDAWMFVPLIATAVTLPLIATLLLGFSAWHLATSGPSIASTQPTTFAMRWPDKSMPQIALR
jgi:hypothetical protein